MSLARCFFYARKGVKHMDVEITDHSAEVAAALEQALQRGLEKCGMTAEGYAKRLCDGFKHATGTLSNSITHQVDTGTQTVYIGSNLEYAPYVELGTGKYYPGGRPTPWVYQDVHGNWHYTHGNRAQPYLKPAVADHADQYRAILEAELKNG